MDEKSNKNNSILDKIYYASVFFLGFTQALTFKIGFPLKIFEILILLYLFLYLFIKAKSTFVITKLHILFTLFMGMILISTILNSVWVYEDNEINYSSFFRISYVADSYLKLGYYVLSFVYFLISFEYFRKDEEKLIKVFTNGAILVSIVTIFYFTWSYLFGISNTPLLMGMKIVPTQTAYVFGKLVIRSGPQAEGNPLGLYLFAAFFFSLKEKNKWYPILIFTALLMSMSTIAYMCVFIYFLSNFIVRLLKLKIHKTTLRYFLFILIGVQLLFLLSPKTKEYIFSKLPFVSSKEDHYSKTERMFFIETAINMGNHNPFIGVGLHHFSAHYLHYAKYNPKIDPKEFTKEWVSKDKVLPHNIYFEIYSEMGGIALLLFILCNLYIFFKLRGVDLKTFFLSILIYFNTIPTLSLTFIWFLYSFFVYQIYKNDFR